MAWDEFYRDKMTKVVDHASRKQCSMTRKKNSSRDDKDTDAKDTHKEFAKQFFLLIFSLRRQRTTCIRIYEESLSRHLAGTTKKRSPAPAQKQGLGKNGECQ